VSMNKKRYPYWSELVGYRNWFERELYMQKYVFHRT